MPWPLERALSLGKILLFGGGLLPAVLLGWEAYRDQLGPNPVETLQRTTGAWAFNFLLLTLAVTPVRQWMGWPWLIRLRRMLGLFAFFYASLHLLAFAVFDHDLDLAGIADDIVERRFITAGFAAWLLMLPLAASSTKRVIRGLGGPRWKALHRLVYVVLGLAVIHYLWLAKGSALLWPIAYAMVAGLLLGWRLIRRLRKPAGK